MLYDFFVDIEQILRKKIEEIVKEKLNFELDPQEIAISFPVDMRWGDYTTNVGLMLAKEVKQPAMDIAKNISYELENFDMKTEEGGESIKIFKKIDFVEPGFINFSLSDNLLLWKLKQGVEKSKKNSVETNIGQYRGKKVLVEYTDPNPFKVFHIGHLMTNAIGESFSRLLEYSGADVIRVNYQGDVGMHVAKSIWGVLKFFSEKDVTLTSLEKENLDFKVKFLGEAYAEGNKAYEEQKSAKKEIEELNFLVYMAAQEVLVEERNWKPLVNYEKFLGDKFKYSLKEVKELYKKGRNWSLEDFENLYVILGTKFDKYYMESEVSEYGLKIVLENMENKIFVEDDGAIIFRGEDHGLHNRVFVNSKGLPIYEAKDLGLAVLKYEDNPYDLSVIVTANEINDYFKVVIKAMSQINEKIAKRTLHFGHGMLRFESGKMGSRTGNIISGKSLILDVKEAVLEKMDSKYSKKEKEEISNQLAVGAVKYGILSHGVGKDIVYNQERSLMVTGNTGPYLQYTHARANSLLLKAKESSYEDLEISELEGTESQVLRQLVKFETVVLRSAAEFSPNSVCEYLFELAQKFNVMYNDLPILKADEEAKRFRLLITKRTKETLARGLWLLGIESPDKV